MAGKWKSTIVIWSDFDPYQVELSRLAREAEEGDAICTLFGATFIEEPLSDLQFEGAEEFWID